MKQIATPPTFGARLKLARKEAKLTQAALAKKVGMSQSNLSELESGAYPSSSYTAQLADATGVNALWLADGRGLMQPGPLLSPSPNTQAASPAAQSNVSPGPDRKGKVPIISWVKAGDWSHAADLLSPGDALDWAETGVGIRPHTFALRVEGDSMEPEFSQGTIIVVEPEMDATPGDYVVAKNGDDEATFKQLVRDGADLYLKPLNPRYPIKPLGSSRIIGVVREAVKRYK